jgi:hypothetical protein
MWEGRFKQTAVLKDGVLTKTPVYTRLNKAFYDKGSWLRGEGTSRQGQQDEQAKLKEIFPEYSDDPEVWWKVQNDESKLKILRAFAAESLFKVKELQGKACSECGGKGAIGRTGRNDPLVCYNCRGLKVHTIVVYQ